MKIDSLRAPLIGIRIEFLRRQIFESQCHRRAEFVAFYHLWNTDGIEKNQSDSKKSFDPMRVYQERQMVKAYIETANRSHSKRKEKKRRAKWNSTGIIPTARRSSVSRSQSIWTFSRDDVTHIRETRFFGTRASKAIHPRARDKRKSPLRKRHSGTTERAEPTGRFQLD